MSSIGWGILGTGTMAELFVQALVSLPGAKVRAVAARSQDRADKFAAKFQIPSAVEGYHRLLQDAAVDVVYISTSNEHHYQNCLEAIGAGKPVLCEKPFALTAKEGAEVVRLARSRRVFCMEAMWMRFAPAVRDAVALAKEGKLGEVEFFSGQLGFPYLPEQEGRLFRQPGGGALLDLGVYPLSLGQALFGTPDRIMSSAALSATQIDEQFTAILTYKEGIQGMVAASLKAKLSNSASIHGRKGVLFLEEPLYFPERYRLLKTPSHSTRQRSPGRLAKLRRYPVVRSLAELRNRAQVRSVSRRVSESGYSFEAAEVQRCLRAGLLESAEMPLSATLAVLETMDSIRAQWEKI